MPSCPIHRAIHLEMQLSWSYNRIVSTNKPTVDTKTKIQAKLHVNKSSDFDTFSPNYLFSGTQSVAAGSKRSMGFKRPLVRLQSLGPKNPDHH